MVPTRLLPIALLIAVAAMLAGAPLPSHAQEGTQYGDLALRVVGMLEEEHFLREPFNEKMASRTLDSYLEMLDYSRIYFTKEDIDGFNAKFRKEIHKQVRGEGIPAAFAIFAVYEERVRDRVEFAKSLAVPDTFTYDSDRTVQISRKESEWATAGEAHDQLWRNLIEGDLLRERLIAEAVEKKKKEEAEKAAAEGKEPKPDKDDPDANKSIYEKVSERYDRILKRIKENTTEDVATMFIKAIAAAYDPHSEYFSQQQYDNFRIGMNKSLTGIGAMLQKDEDQGGATIEGLVVGGPAFKVGKLKVKDRVIAVAQGPEGEFVDVVEMKLSDIVDLIRGEIGSMVRLKVLPTGKADEIEFVDIVRDKIDLKDSLATADLIITKDPAGEDQRLGWITLPSFYADMDGGQTSTTADVRRLLVRLTIEGINGLVIDLRDNGGGSLEEAINMTGLFIRKGPVVQSLDWRGNLDPKYSRNGEAVYGGPLVVLVNHASASASEIFAAALQDYGRAVIVGDESTFGKGTVQQLRPVMAKKLSLFSSQPPQDGALKLTIQTFYRINGHSTQRDGVIPEIRLPSMLDIAEIGESSLPNALEVEPIEPNRYLPFFEKPIDIELLQKASQARVASGRDFEYILKDINDEKARIERNTISLNLDARNKESAKLEKEREDRKQAQIAYFDSVRKAEEGLFTVYKLTQDNVLEEKLILRDDLSDEQLSGMSRGTADDEEEDPEDKLLEYPHKLDPYARETLRIVQDLIAIGKTGKPVNISEAKPEPRQTTVPITKGRTGGTQAN